MNNSEKIIIGLLALGGGIFALLYVFNKHKSTKSSTPQQTSTTTTTTSIPSTTTSIPQTTTSTTISIPSSTYSYTFKENGLPSNALWSVTVNGNSITAKAGENITFNGLSGSNPWTVASSIVGSAIYQPSPASGTATQNGSITITFSSPSSSSTTSSSSGKNVGGLRVCDTNIQNGDYAYVHNQKYTIINASAMKNDAKSSDECYQVVAAFIEWHPYGNGLYWITS